jgi:conjugal transfer pilus assembly protein TraD
MSAPLFVEADGERGVVLAKRVGGERALPTSEGLVVLSPERLCRHMLVCGATGSGKTETLLRLAWTIAKTSETPVFYLDGKGDRKTAQRFSGLMADAGRECRVFPNEPFDGWRGEAHEIQGRLMEIVDYASDGPASWYRDVAKNVLGLVCEHPDGPPRSSGQALDRMDIEALRSAHDGSNALAALAKDQVRQVRLRYQAFFGQTRGMLDGGWAWEDARAAYLLLDTLRLREETNGLARLLFEDFAHYFTTRKPREQFCVLIVDEFSALASGTSMAGRVEQARGFHTGLILAPQVVAGMGDEQQAERILGSVETVVCHRVNTPERIAALAGTRERPEYSMHYDQEGANGEGSVRIQHQFKVEPNAVRSLQPGEAYLISRGRAMRANILTAPDLRASLPADVQRASATPTSCGDGPSVTVASQARAPHVPLRRVLSEKEVADLPF